MSESSIELSWKVGGRDAMVKTKLTFLRQQLVNSENRDTIVPQISLSAFVAESAKRRMWRRHSLS